MYSQSRCLARKAVNHQFTIDRNSPTYDIRHPLSPAFVELAGEVTLFAGRKRFVAVKVGEAATGVDSEQEERSRSEASFGLHKVTGGVFSSSQITIGEAEELEDRSSCPFEFVVGLGVVEGSAPSEITMGESAEPEA